MSNDKPLSNGHAPAKTLSQAPSAVRMRLHKERRARGAIVIRDVVIEADLISALVQLGWVHGIEAQNREAVEHGLFALILQAINAGMRPAQPGKAFVPVDLKALQEAWAWAKPNSPATPENAGQAIANVSRCALIAGFTPEAFSARMREMLDATH